MDACMATWGSSTTRTNDYSKAIPSLGLAVNGGSAADGTPVEAIPLDYGRVEEYYWYLGFALARI